MTVPTPTARDDLPFGRDAPPRPSRETVAVVHHGYRIQATASRRVTGAVLVNAELSGGPDAIRRWFCVASDRDDLTAACEQCIAELKQIIDELAGGARKE